MHCDDKITETILKYQIKRLPKSKWLEYGLICGCMSHTVRWFSTLYAWFVLNEEVCSSFGDLRAQTVIKGCNLLGDMLHSNISPIVSVRIFISIYLYLLLYEFCSSIISKNPMTMIFKFWQYLWPYLESCTSPIQPDHSTMTSSRRHFVNSRYHSYLHNHSF